MVTGVDSRHTASGECSYDDGPTRDMLQINRFEKW